MVALNTIPVILGVLFYQVLMFLVVRDFCYLFPSPGITLWEKHDHVQSYEKQNPHAAILTYYFFSPPKDLAHLCDIGSRSLFQASTYLLALS